MKRQTIIILLCWVALTVAAQKDMSLLTALQAIERSQSEYAIDIVCDGLDSLRTTANVKGLDAVKAVKRVCKGLPVKVKVHGKRIYVQHERGKVVRKISLNGEVQDIRAHKPLIGATVELLDADSTVLQQKVPSIIGMRKATTGRLASSRSPCPPSLPVIFSASATWVIARLTWTTSWSVLVDVSTSGHCRLSTFRHSRRCCRRWW